MKVKLLLFLFTTVSIQTFSMRLSYTLSFPEPQTHYIEVSLRISDHKKHPVDLKMPVWTPGSYLVREFSRHIESFEGKNADIRKTAKNHWRIKTDHTEDIIINYRIYAYELSVRTSFVDADMALINGASVFLRADTKEKTEYEVAVIKPAQWSQISTSLTYQNDPWRRTAESFDELIDSPILAGNQKIHAFDVNGVPHTIVMAGEVQYNPKKLVEDVKQVCTEATKVIGEHPCKNYTFIVINASSGSGGLEHANSCVLHTSRAVYTNEGQYKNFLGLVAHEYFHLWNVKRIRPKELGPFDYDNENYTTMLWISEGFTSYYDDLISAKAGIISPERFIEICSSNINSIENAPGNKVQPVAEASFDAWIKYYRSNENSSNSTTNYYTKGSVLALLLDLDIISATKGQKCLDDLMRQLYDKYYKKLSRGFTEEEFKTEAEAIAGKNLDDFFKKYVYQTDPLDYNTYLTKAGLVITDLNEGRQEIGLGVSVNNAGGRNVVTSVLRGAPGWKYGLNVNDEIISIDGVRVSGDISQILSNKETDSIITIMVNRDGYLKEISLKLEPYRTSAYRLDRIQKPDEEQQQIFRKWLLKRW